MLEVDWKKALLFNSRINHVVCEIARNTCTIAELGFAVSITSLTISNSRRRVLLNITPNAFPASRVIVKRDIGDDSPIDYIQVRISTP